MVLALLLAAACTGKDVARDGVHEDAHEGGTGPGPAAREQINPGPAWPALTLLETGGNPLWFELSSGSPSLIDSPAQASLAPFAPWPNARYVAGMEVWNNYLVMAVNRVGFIILGPAAKDSNVIMYSAASGGLWEPYTTESFFIWEDKPSALLYRNDFFADLNAPSPRPQVYALDPSSPIPVGVHISALENFPPGRSWETEAVRRASDGYWYYRMKEKGEAQNETAYFCTRDLKQNGDKISFGEWMNSNKPESPENAPAYLASVLNNASKMDPGEIAQVKVISPDFDSPRFFGSAGSSAGTENPALLYAFCRESDSLALAILPGGRGLYSAGRDAEIKPFSLPALPEGFVYTGAALIGSVLVVSWEEQQEAGIGAAGFLVVNTDLPGSLPQRPQ